MSPGERRSWARTATVTGVALLPLLVHWAVRVVVTPRPYWAYFFDPESMYFYSSLEFLDGGAPVDVDNPGTPIHLLGALIALFTGSTPLALQTFLHVGYVIAILATAGGVVLLARRVLADLPGPAVVACVWLYFLCPQALSRSVIWGAEPFQFGAGCVALLLLVRALERPGDMRSSAWAGAGVGFLVAMKFTFVGCAVAVVLAAADAARGRRPAFVGGATVVGVVGGFALGTLPAWVRWPEMVERVLRLATGEGHAPVWAESPHSGWEPFLDALGSSRTWVALLALLVAGLIVGARSRREEDAADPRLRGLAVFGVVAIVATYAAGARSSYLRYYLPSALGALALACSVLGLLRGRTLRAAMWTGAVLIGGLLGRQIAMDLEWSARITDEHHRLREAAAQAIRGAAPGAEPVVLYGGRFPEPAFALLLFSRTQAQRREVGERYPLQGLYDRRGRHTWLPGTQRPWDFLVLEDHDLATFPEPVGAVIATVGASLGTTGTYRIVARPR